MPAYQHAKWLRKFPFDYLLSTCTIAVGIILCFPLAKSESYHLVAFVLLLLVSFLATMLTSGPIILASTLGAISWNFFFIPPSKTFHIERTDDILIFGLFFSIALLNGVFTSRLRMQKELVRKREKNTNALLDLTKALSTAKGTSAIHDIANQKIEQQFKQIPPPPEEQLLWEAFNVQIAHAIEREELNSLAEQAHLLTESDLLYKTLFSSLSHEFRIPVATIMGASDTLLNGQFTIQNQTELLTQIFSATVRLNHLIENLLNMSRLESGKLAVRADWHDLHDLVNKVSEQLNSELSTHPFFINIPESLPLVRIDFGLMEQVIYNILVNCTQHTPEGTHIILSAEQFDGRLSIYIKDKGIGFSEDQLKNLFNRFYRIKNSKAGGLGLGLSIAKGFVEAHNGTISINNHPEGGACFHISLPSETPNLNELPIV